MQSNVRRYVTVLAVAAALGLGIAIGTFISHTVQTAHASKANPDPRVIADPSPVALSNSFARIAAEIEPAVVNINTETTVRLSAKGFGSNGEEPFNDLFNHFFRFGKPGQGTGQFQRRSLGSGVILNPRGFILTNYHVVMQRGLDKPVDRIEVYLHGQNGTKYQARIVGADKWTDLAVIKIDAGKKLTAAQFGDSSSVQVGDWVLAVGSPFGLSSTVTAGIISAKGREIEPGMKGQFKRFIQTDAAINPGNSGGALVNCAGQLVGIPSAGATVPSTTGQPASGGDIGLGFAIPVDLAKTVSDELIATGRVTHAYLGLEAEPLSAGSGQAARGLYVTAVDPSGPAAAAGIRPGDIVTAIEGTTATSADQLVELSLRQQPGSQVTLRFDRSGQHASATVVLGREP